MEPSNPTLMSRRKLLKKELPNSDNSPKFANITRPLIGVNCATQARSNFRKRKYSQIRDDNMETSGPTLKICRPFSPSNTLSLSPSRIRPISHLSRNDKVDKDNLALAELGDPDLILDEDQRARSQIKGKVGKNTKIKSSKRRNPDLILDDPDVEMFEVESEITASHSSTVTDHDHCIIDKFGNPNVIADTDDTNMEDTNMDEVTDDGLDQFFTTNDNGQLEFEFNSTAIQADILADANANLANAIQDTPYDGPSEPFNGIHRHPSGSGDAVAGPSKIPHRSTYMRQKKRFRTKTDDDNLIRDTFGDILGGGRKVKKLLKMIQANPGLVDKLLEHTEDDKDSDVGIPPIRSLALMHQAGLTLEQWNMVNKFHEFPLLNMFQKFPLLKMFQKFPLLKMFQKFPLLKMFQKFPLLKMFQKFPLLKMFQNSHY
jgi:hypothetical protein